MSGRVGALRGVGATRIARDDLVEAMQVSGLQVVVFVVMVICHVVAVICGLFCNHSALVAVGHSRSEMVDKACAPGWDGMGCAERIVCMINASAQPGPAAQA